MEPFWAFFTSFFGHYARIAPSDSDKNGLKTAQKSF
jgi:hypothetical protein